MNESRFESLTAALEGRFNRPFKALPENLQRRVLQDLTLPYPWDKYTSEERRSAAAQWDYHNDPAMAPLRKAAWDYCQECDEWKSKATPTALDKVAQDSGLRAAQERFTAFEQKFNATDDGHIRVRQDRMSFEIEDAIRELGAKYTPAHVLRKLASYIGKSGSCIVGSNGNGVRWKDERDKPHDLDIDALKKRIYRRKAR